ncbi:MAG: alpha/beta hydrolase [Eubacteriales bacterium]
MKTFLKRPWKTRWKILFVLVLLLIFGFLGLCIYASDYRTLKEEFYDIFQEADVYSSSGMIHFQADSEIGLVFYPGGRVEYLAYAPFCQKLQQAGINVFLVDMPFNMANFGVFKANSVMKDNPEIEEWYLGGHSLGGVAANMYASSNADKISGLILVGIYLSMDYDMEKTITINGSEDLRVGDSVDYTTNVHVIEGGNHAQFGNYGENEGDGIATISTEEQQNQAVALIAQFIGNNTNSN